MNRYKWIYSYIKKFRFRILLGLFLDLILVALALLNPYISGRIIGEVFEGQNHALLPTLLFILLVGTLLKGIIRYTFLMNFESLSQSILLSLRRDLYRQVQLQTFGFFDSNRVGDIMARMTGDLDAIRHFIAYVIYAIFENVISFTLAIILMFSLSWQITVCMLVIAPVMLFCTMRQSKDIKPAFILIREQFSKLNSVCQENISGNRVVKAFAKEGYEIEKFNTENETFKERNVNASKIWIKYLPITDFCAGLMFFILLIVGGSLVAMGKLELWKFVTFNGYLWAINMPLRVVGWLVNDTQRFVASLEKIYDMVSQKIYIENPEKPHKPTKVRGEVEFKNLCFSYDRTGVAENVLKDISFKANAGDIIGIVGETGSGKTTLINMIGRFYDACSGSVKVDGVDVRNWDLKTLRSSIAAANQDVFLFSDTVEGNIAYGVPNALMEDVYKSAEIADTHGFIQDLEEGYDTIIGERGVGLSGGQKQRLALARAIATNPQILILDDTTSAVDMETESKIQAALKATATRTTFIIAHRISSVKDANLIICLNKGKIVEKGTHNELIALKGYYYNMYINQYGGVEDGQK